MINNKTEVQQFLAAKFTTYLQSAQSLKAPYAEDHQVGHLPWSTLGSGCMVILHQRPNLYHNTIHDKLAKTRSKQEKEHSENTALPQEQLWPLEYELIIST